jgi:phthalate 4,5-dioxygenase oxygenase subunit
MITHDQNERLVRVEGDAPMGILMREHYWIPGCLSSQLVADGAPQRVRLLGKDYVAFRATDGRIGFFDERCPHRGVSLVLARNEDCALRCIFHAWKIDVSGKVVEVPTQATRPEEFAARVRVNHYRTHEGGGIVWVWLGNQAAVPKFPELPFTILPENQVWMTITMANCNWLQGMEGTIDSAHVGTLHGSYIDRLVAKGDRTNTYSREVLAPRYEVERTPYGLAATALRPLPDGSIYVRTTPYIMPFVTFTPGGEEAPAVIFITSPVDDTHHNLFYGTWARTVDIKNADKVPDIMGSIVGNLPHDPHNFGRFTSDRNRSYGQDREAMKQGHFSGFVGNLLQEDMVVQASMGPIVDRTRDYLSTADMAVVHARNMLLEALDDVAAGRTPRGAGADRDFRDVLPTNILVPPGGDRSGAVVDFYKAAS